MQTNLLWTGIEYYSLENCLVNTGNTGNEISSNIIGCFEQKIYSVAYFIETDINWQTRFLEINYRINNKENKITLQKDACNNWLFNNSRTDLFEHCIDVDISVTPFTNSLPVNRLKLLREQEAKINVIYINIFEQQVKALQQTYQRLSDGKFLYKNFPNDFEAEIEVDMYGFVINYPSLFKRTTIIQTIE